MLCKRGCQVAVEPVSAGDLGGRWVADLRLVAVLPDDHSQGQVEGGQRGGLDQRRRGRGAADDEQLRVPQREPDPSCLVAVVDHREDLHPPRRNDGGEPSDRVGHRPRAHLRDDDLVTARRWVRPIAACAIVRSASGTPACGERPPSFAPGEPHVLRQMTRLHASRRRLPAVDAAKVHTADRTRQTSAHGGALHASTPQSRSATNGLATVAKARRTGRARGGDRPHPSVPCRGSDRRRRPPRDRRARGREDRAPGRRGGRRGCRRARGSSAPPASSSRPG